MSRNAVFAVVLLAVVIGLALLYGFFGNEILGLEKAGPEVSF